MIEVIDYISNASITWNKEDVFPFNKIKPSFFKWDKDAVIVLKDFHILSVWAGEDNTLIGI